MVATQSGREPIQIVEILQPICEHVCGANPCTATGSGDAKCYNTRATCLDAGNFSLGAPLSLYFGKGLQAEQDLGVVVIPSLISVSTTPTRINLAGASPDAQGLGNRGTCQIVFQDHQHSDRVVDPYRGDRSWDPMSPERGSFWTRWMPRNKYRLLTQVRIHEGYAGQSLAEMVSRTFFVEKATGPNAQGRVTFTGKDILAQIEERKAQAPLASPGVLFADIDATQTSFEVAGTIEGEYSATGTVRIGDEIMTYSDLTASENGVLISGVTRGTDNTAAAPHSFDSGVQECLRYTAEPMNNVIDDLLTTFSGIDQAWLETSSWAAEVADFLPFYNLTNLVTEPRAVSSLVSDILEQCGVYLWWDERLMRIRLKSIRGVDSEPPLLNDRQHIVQDSFAIQEKPRERASQVWIYYNRQDSTKSRDDPSAYESQFVVADLDSETDELYGSASIRKIYADWLPTGGLAQSTASRIITRYVDVPSECAFQLDAKDRSYWVGDTVQISHPMDRDQHGTRRLRRWTIIEAEEVVPGERVRYRAEDTTLYGIVHRIAPDGASDFGQNVSNPFGRGFIGDDAGLLSDATPAARIA